MKQQHVHFRRFGWGAAMPASSSLGRLNGSVSVPVTGGWWRRLLAFAGPGYLVSVGYMDPGNWATDLAGGSRFGYMLLSVVLLSSLMAMLLQALAARLGIATGLDLAQACRARYRPSVNLLLWVASEAAIIACDLAEVIGTAIALNLLFGIPLVLGAVLTALDVFVVLLLMQRGFRRLEAFVLALLLVIVVCFGIQIVLARPAMADVFSGFIPRTRILTDPTALYLAIGIMGATIMPHNLYLHSAVVQTRDYPRTPAGRRDGLRWAVTDSVIALLLALFVNAAILITAAAVFHAAGRVDVEEIGQAYHLLAPMLGVGAASLVFAVALLASGMNSTVTATLAGQIVMEGFLNLRIPGWARRLLTRALAIVPVLIVTGLYGASGTARLLVFSQVVLSMQLPFAVIPLVRFVSDRKLMGAFAIGRVTTLVAWAVAVLVCALNVKLLLDAVS